MSNPSRLMCNLRLTVLHLTSSWHTVRVWLQLVFLLFIVTLIVVINEPIAQDSGLLTQIYLVLQMATFGAEWSLPQIDAIPTSPAFEALRIILPLVSLGGLLLVGFRSIGHWMQLRLMPKKGHTVVFGLGHAGMAYVSHWKRLSNKLSYGPLLVIERDSTNPNIPLARSMGIPVIISNVGNDGWLGFRKAVCHRAARIISMMSTDSNDIELTLHIQRYLNQASAQRKPKLFVQINEPKLAKRLSDYPRICSSDLIDLRFESLYGLFAEDLFLRHPPELYADVFGEIRPNIAIHGFNDLGEQVLNYCVLLCHYRNHQTAKVTIYDSNPERAKQAVIERYPGLLPSTGDGYKAPLELHFLLDESHELGEDPATQHIICEMDEEKALSMALKLRARSLRQKRGNAPIFVKSASREGLAALLESNTGEAEIPDGIYPFGMLEDVTDPEILDNSELDRISKGIHEFAYRAIFQANTLWSDLDPSKRRSNRYAVLHLDTKFRAAGWRRILKPDFGVFASESTRRINEHFPCVTAGQLQDGKNGVKKADAALERLSVMEHNRWVGAQVAEGWVQSRQRFDALKMHDLLTPWDRLEEEQKPKDRAQLRVLPGLVECNKDAIKAAIAETFEDQQEKTDCPLDLENYDMTLLERDGERGSAYVVPVINVGILCPRVPQKMDVSPSGIKCRYTATIDDTIRRGVISAIDKLSERLREAVMGLSVPETLAFTIITPLVSDPEQAAFHFLKAKLKAILNEEIESKYNGFRPGYQTEALITLPLPYNFMTETGVFGEAITESNPDVKKFPWFPGGGAGLQRNAGKRNVRYVEMPLIHKGSNFGREPARTRALALQDQFEWTWSWILKRSDFLIMIVDDEISHAKALEIKKDFASPERAAAAERHDGLLPTPALLGSVDLKDCVEIVDIR